MRAGDSVRLNTATSGTLRSLRGYVCVCYQLGGHRNGEQGALCRCDSTDNAVRILVAIDRSPIAIYTTHTVCG